MFCFLKKGREGRREKGREGEGRGKKGRGVKMLHTDIRHTDPPTKRVLEEHSLLKRKADYGSHGEYE